MVHHKCGRCKTNHKSGRCPDAPKRSRNAKVLRHKHVRVRNFARSMKEKHGDRFISVRLGVPFELMAELARHIHSVSQKTGVKFIISNPEAVKISVDKESYVELFGFRVPEAKDLLESHFKRVLHAIGVPKL